MERKFLCFRSSWELDQTKKCYTSTYMWQEFQFAVVSIMIPAKIRNILNFHKTRLVVLERIINFLHARARKQIF